MEQVKHDIAVFLKNHLLEIGAGGVGFISGFVIDWNHIAERAVETTIVATINGACAATAGFIAVWLLKKIFKKNNPQ